MVYRYEGESVEDIEKSTAYAGYEKCIAGRDIVVKHEQDPEYLSYALAATDARRQKSAGKVKSKVVHSGIPSIAAIKTPVPPLPVQREIVLIPDNFTELTEELTAWKKQYEYYRDRLFAFDTALYMPLKEYFPDIRNGFVGTVTSFFTNAEEGLLPVER